ncbi:MAG: FAD-dependent oxidoreductase [Lysobacteraceae bacterium]
MKSQSQTFDAIIVGAGPAGCTAAILLAQAGWSVALIEKHAFPRRKVCGECIAATNLPLLDALGVGDAFNAVAGPELRKAALFVGERTLQADLPPLRGSSHPWGRALGREHLDTLLLHRASDVGAHLWQPWTVKQIERDNAQHVCHLLDVETGATQQLSAPILIAAHGSWELDPAIEHARRPPKDSDLFAFKGTFRSTQMTPGVLPVLAFCGGYGGMVLGDHGLTTLAFCIRRDALRKARERHPGMKAALAAQMHVQTECTGAREVMAGAKLDAPWLAVGPIQPGIRKAWRGLGHFAVGNVAGEAHPILGEGISMAMQSAWLLCERLLANPAGLRSPSPSAERMESVGNDYAKHWHKAFASRIRLAAIYAHLAMRPRRAAVLLPLLQQWPGLLTLGARAGGKVREVVQIPDATAIQS